MSWLAAEDRASALYLEGLLGASDREIIKFWTTRSALVAEQEWIALVNEIARNTPGTLAHKAVSDKRMPPRFREVAPDYESLGWRTLSIAAAEDEIADALAVALLGGKQVRDLDAAREVARAFTAIFGVGASFLTNVADDDDGPSARSTGSWAAACPLTPAVAEAGVMAVGAGKVGLLWVTES